MSATNSERNKNYCTTLHHAAPLCTMLHHIGEIKMTHIRKFVFSAKKYSWL
jgi:hypothetical protein